MTTQPSAKTAPEETPEPYYAIDPAAIEALGRSATVVVASRLCEAAREKAGPPEKLRSVKFADLRKLLRQHCKDDAEFLNPQLPIAETVFRLLLIMQDGPVALSTLHNEVARLWMDATWPRNISTEALARVLSNDRYYGVVEVAPQEKAPPKRSVP